MVDSQRSSRVAPEATTAAVTALVTDSALSRSSVKLTCSWMPSPMSVDVRV